MKNFFQKLPILLVSILLVGCQNRNDNAIILDKNSANKSYLLIADTIHLFRSNGTLAPTSQFQLEWIVTNNQISYFEKKGEEKGVDYVIKINATDWNRISAFDKTLRIPKDTINTDGAEEFYIEFIVKGKTYSYPASLFESKTAIIEQLTQQFFKNK